MKSIEKICLCLSVLLFCQSQKSFAGPGEYELVSLVRDPLVTYVGTFKPSFVAIENDPSILAKLQKSLKELELFNSDEVDINALMSSEDKVATQAAANVIAKKFLTAADTLAQIKVLNIKLGSLKQLLQGKDLEIVKQVYIKRTQELFRGLVLNFISIENETIGVLENCKSEMCTFQASSALRDLMSLGKSINKNREEVRGVESVLLQAALDETYKQWKLKNENSREDQVLLGFLSELIQVAKGQQSARQMLNDVLSPKQLKLVQDSNTRVSKTRFYNESLYLDQLISAKLSAVVGNTAYTKPLRKEYRYSYTLDCGGLNDWVTLMGFRWNNKSYDRSTFVPFCQCLEDGKKYSFDSLNVGPGLSVFGPHGRIKILSVVPITLKGTWRGLNVGAGAGIGASGSVLFGKKGSVAMIVTGGGGIGAHVAYSSITFTPLNP